MIGTSREEVLRLIKERIEKDSNKKTILANIEWIKSNRRGFTTL